MQAAKRKDNPNEEEKQGNGRYLTLVILVLVFFVIFVIRLFDWQVIQGTYFRQKAETNELNLTTLEGTRGEIFDADGNVLTGNKTSYGIQFNANTMDKNDRNPTLVNLLLLLDDYGESWIDDLPIYLDEEGNYQFVENREDDIAYLKSDKFLDLQEYATADHCMAALAKMCNVSGYNKKLTRDLLSIRFSMKRDGFSVSEPYLISDDISQEMVGLINQKKNELPGVETKVIVTPYYGEDGTLAPHIVGTYGAINETELENMKKNGEIYDAVENPEGYKATDYIGKTGIQAAFEEELRGISGVERVNKDDDGNVIGTVMDRAPTTGNSIHLTIQPDLQTVLNESVRENVLNNPAPLANTGAAVAMDVKTGNIMAASNYPSFDLTRYYEDEKYLIALNNDSSNPQFNFAFEGAFTPGSIFKPLVAVAMLQENTGPSFYTCAGWYDYYETDRIECLAHRGSSGTTVEVQGALQQSCNSFFCEAGRLLKIEPLRVYAEYFGLGVKTGTEIYEEKGNMSNPTDFERLHQGVKWMDGNTVAASIGQLDDSFTPVQLASYCTTLANDGKRYRARLVQKITNYNGTEVIEEYEPEVMMDAQIDSWVMETVKGGMRNAAHSPNGTAYSVFGDYGIQICAKTGTAETDKDSANITFIAFAPADDPQVAVAVVMQYADKGSYAMNVAKDFFDAYFEEELSANEGENENEEKGEESSASSMAPEEEVTLDGENLNLGAFFDPERDLPKKTPKPSSESSEESEEEGETEGEGSSEPEA